MSHILALPLFLLSFSAFAQTSGKFVEVAVKEDVHLKVISVKMSLSVYTEEQQMSELYSHEEENYEMYDYEAYPEVEYSVDDKTKAEQEADEELMEAREKEELEKERERQEEQERLLENFKPYTLQDLMKTLRENDFSFEIEARAMSEDYDEWQDMIERQEVSDSILYVSLRNEENSRKLLDLLAKKPIDSDLEDLVFENADPYLIELAPKMLERARKQAEALAAASGKKLGTIQQISNVYPGFSPALIEAQFKRSRDYNRHDWNQDNPFKSSKPAYIEVLYRFSILD